MDIKTSKLTAEGIIGEAVRIGAKMSGGEFPIEVFPIRIQRITKRIRSMKPLLERSPLTSSPKIFFLMVPITEI